ncbi:MAG: RHS repeat-associated core domain-containing protein, partial [Parachlamydiaceae bacterium]|nr:RHS repeat-associated core domain-containing protein [Parachlamydiaceae bacterium]
KAHRLMDVHRLSEEKQRLYTHSYLDYDLEDKVLRSKLIGNIGSAEFKYDRLGRPTKLQYKKWKEIISSYDSVGNILKRKVIDACGEVSCNYSYDDLYQVIKENGVAAHSYAFDSLHNRIKKDDAKMKLNDLNQILPDSKVGYTYDLNGNLTEMKTTDGKISFRYDALDRLTEVLSKNQRVCYTYDPLNRRLSKRCDTKGSQKKWSTGNKIKFLYVGDNEIGSYDDKGVAQELRLLGLSKGAEIGGAIAIELQGQVYAPLHDHLGNVTALIDAKTAKPIEVYRYTSFGEEQVFDGEGNSIQASINPWRFSSKRVDSETGFVYFGRRYYNPELGRWISPDPIGKSGGPNPYAYVLNKPLTCFDAYGLFGQNDDFNECGRNPYHSSLRGTYNYCLSSLRGFGSHLTDFGFQLPIPVVRDVMQILGRSLSGRGFDDFYLTFCGKSISGNLGLPELYPSQPNVTIGGNFTSLADMLKRAYAMSEHTGGNNVHYFCQASDGILLDAVKACFAKNVIALPADRDCAEFMLPILEMAGPQGRTNAECFSRGAILVDNLQDLLPEGMCKMLNVKNYGGGAILKKSDFFDAENYISEHDPVPLLSTPITYHLAKIFPRSDVIFLKSKSFPYCDHSWDSETYQKVIINNHGKIFANQNELK